MPETNHKEEMAVLQQRVTELEHLLVQLQAEQMRHRQALVVMWRRTAAMAEQLKKERQELRADVTRAWDRVINMVQTQQAHIKNLQRDQRDTDAALYRLIGNYPKRAEMDTDYLITQQMRRWIKKLIELIGKHFSIDELQALCLDMDLDWENLGSNGKDTKVRRMVEYYYRQNRLEDLTQVLQRERSFVKWPMTLLDIDIEIDVEEEVRGIMGGSE